MAFPAPWYPRATRRPVPNTASPRPGEGRYLHDVAGLFTRDPIGWGLHVVVGNGSPFQTFLTARSPGRRFSHLWVSKAGAVEQYAPFTHKSWAMGDANGSFVTVETEGFPTEPLSDAQVAALAAFHAWSGLPDRVATTPTEGGITCHYVGGAAWGGHSCPDPPGQEGRGPRSRQRAAILAAAASLRTQGDDVPLADAEKTDIAKKTVAELFARNVHTDWAGDMSYIALISKGVGAAAAAQAALNGLAGQLAVPLAQALVPAITAALKASGGALSDADVQRIAVAAADEQAKRMVR